MNFAFFYKLQDFWPFKLLKDGDVRASDDLVRDLPVPENTKKFVFAVLDRNSHSTVYILAVQGLSERSASDADCLIKAVRPQVVLAQVGRADLSEVQSEGDELIGNVESSFPTSPYGVIVKCFIEKFTKERYDIVARNLILRVIFGVGFHGHVLAAKKAADDVGSSFLLLKAPVLTKSSQTGDNAERSSDSKLKRKSGTSEAVSGLSKGFSSDHVQSQMNKILSTYLDVPKVTGSAIEHHSSTLSNDLNAEDRCILPEFAQSIHSLFVDLHTAFIGIPLLNRALSCLQKMLVDVNRGESVDKSIVSEVYTFRVAIEGLRIALNDAGRLPITKSERVQEKIEFSQLPDDDKSYALLARALQSQKSKFQTIVAVVDANCLRGIRKHWNTSLPSAVEPLVELSVSTWDSERESSNQWKLHWLLSGKPIVTVGAGATAIVGASSLSKVAPLATLMKVVSLKLPTSLKLIFSQTHKVITLALSKSLGPSKLIAPGLAKSGAKTSFMKAISTQHIRTAAHSIIASAEKTSYSAMRTAFYEIMRKRRAKPIGVLPWVTFGGSVATCSALLFYGDSFEHAAEALPAATSIACLGRGIQSLQLVSQEVAKTNANKIQQSIEMLMYSLKPMNRQ